MTCAGVDGCRGGWVVVTSTANDALDAFWASAFAEIIAALPADTILAVDMPIGLTDAGARDCDRAARQFLGRPRASSVFPAPIRPCLQAPDRVSADTIGRRIDGRGVGAQAYNLFTKVREVDQVLIAASELTQRVHEAHPEVCFRVMAGGNGPGHSKRSTAGQAERRALLVDSLAGGPSVFKRLRQRLPRGHVGDDDLSDALAVYWTAQRIRSGQARGLPEPAPRDRFGLPMQIVY